MSDICIVGVGNVGGALAIALSRAGHRITQLITKTGKVERRVGKLLPPGVKVSRSGLTDQIDAEIILLTVQDQYIEDVAADLSENVVRGQSVFHASGSLSSEILQNLAEHGCYTASIHPLSSISDAVRGADQFAGTFFCVEGSRKGVKVCRDLVRDLGGQSFTVETSLKPLYHAAAVASAGHVTALFDSAIEILCKCGILRADASKILFPLLRSTVDNLAWQSPEDALTGTFARLDTKVFESHLRLLQTHLSPEFVELYLLLGVRSLDLIERRSGRSAQTRKFRKLISVAKEKSR